MACFSLLFRVRHHGQLNAAILHSEVHHLHRILPAFPVGVTPLPLSVCTPSTTWARPFSPAEAFLNTGFVCVFQSVTGETSILLSSQRVKFVHFVFFVITATFSDQCTQQVY